MLQSEIEAALVDPEREPPELDGVPGWRRLKGGAPHPEDLRDIVDAVLKVTKPKRVLLFGSGARGEIADVDPARLVLLGHAGIDQHLKLAVTDIDEALLKVDFVLIL